MIPICRDEILTRPARTDFTLRLHREIKFHPGKARQFSARYLSRPTSGPCICIHFLLIFLCNHVSYRKPIASGSRTIAPEEICPPNNFPRIIAP